MIGIKIKNIWTTVVCTFFVLLNLPQLRAQDVCPIVPLPQNSEKTDGQFKLTDRTAITYSEALHDIAFYLQKEILRYQHIPVRLHQEMTIANTMNPVIVLESLAPGQSKTVVGAYGIKMNNRRIVISSDTREGIYNGVISFLQLTRLANQKGDIPLIDCWNINDFPKYQWRGLMLDEARHFFGVEKVKKILDWMA